MLVGGGSGVSVGGGGIGVGVLVGGRGIGVSVGGGTGVGVGTLFEAAGFCPASPSGGTTATLPGVGVKVGQGVRVGRKAASAGSFATREPSLSVRPHPRLTRAKVKTNPKAIFIRLPFRVIVAQLSKTG